MKKPTAQFLLVSGFLGVVVIMLFLIATITILGGGWWIVGIMICFLLWVLWDRAGEIIDHETPREKTHDNEWPR